MVEFIKRSRQTATNQPIGVVRITNDDGGKFRANMAMANAVQGVSKLALDQVKEQYEADDLEAAASQPIFSRNENGELQPNSFDKPTGLFGIGEKERSTQSQNIYNKRFAVATENAMNAEALEISNNTNNAEEFRQQFEAYASEQSALMGENFDPILQAQYQNAASQIANQYATGKLKQSHIKAEQTAVADLADNTFNNFQDVQSLLANGQEGEAFALLDVTYNNIEKEFGNNNQFTASFKNNLMQQGIRSAALGTILNVKQNTSVNPVRLSTALDKALRDGSFTTEAFGDELVELGLSPDQAVRMRAVFTGASPATINNIAQRMSAIKDEEAEAQTNISVASVLAEGSPSQIAALNANQVNSYITPQFVLNILADDIVQGATLKADQQNLVNIIKSTNELPAAFQKQVEDILDGSVRDERTVRNAMTLLRFGAYNKDGLRSVTGINENAVSLFYAALKVNGGNFLEAQKQVFKFETASQKVLRENYAKITQRFKIPTDDLDFSPGTLESKVMPVVKTHLTGLLSSVLGGNPQDFTNQRLLDSLVPAALQVYSTLENPDLIMKEYIRGNIVKTKYLADANYSSVAPERFFASDENEKQFFETANRMIAQNRGIEIPLVSYAIPKSEGFGFPDFETVERAPNLLGVDFFLKVDRRSTETEPKYYIVDKFDQPLQKNGDLVYLDFRGIAANNALKQRMKKNQSIQNAARRNAIKSSDAEKTAQGIARGLF